MKRSYIIALVIVIVAFAAVVSMIYDSSTYATFAIAADNPGKTYHVIGKVNFEKPLNYDPQKNADHFSFYMRDSLGTEVKVNLAKAKPQDFEKSEQIVIIGKMDGSEFKANDMLMKCPSKYTDNKQKVS